MKIILIGDVHGKTHIYQKILRQKYEGQNTIQLGDMGLGFSGVGLPVLPDNHKFFRGNHDSPEKCRAHHNYLGDYGYLSESSVFYVAGAFSIDHMMRVPGKTWWEDEELSYAELDKAVECYRQTLPRFVISHECPANATRSLLHGLMGGYFAEKAECSMSRTAQALQVMFEYHQPEQWIFGHYHVDKEFTVGKTKFRCVAELSQYELDTEKQAA